MSFDRRNKMSNKVNNMLKVPPDGGYGWVVVFAYALNNVIVLPLVVNFGLVFQEAFDFNGISATQGHLIIVLNHSNAMLFTFFGGPLLKRFGYRKIAVFGAICILTGLNLTAMSSSFWMFIVSYSIINSMGLGAVLAAFALAINSFFKEKRSRAIGFGMTLTGLGATCMPLLINALMYAYGWRYTVLILSAICLHSLLAACLLRPAKWYLKSPVLVEETMPLNNKNDVQLINASLTNTSKGDPISLSQIEQPTRNGRDPAKSISITSLTSNNNSSLQAMNAISHPDTRNSKTHKTEAETQYQWWESQEINLGSSINIFNDSGVNEKVKEVEFANLKQGTKKSYTEKIIDFFDLSLLTDPIFVSILCGISIGACVEMIFALQLPFILEDMMKFERSDIAHLMSVIGFADTLFRFMAPFIGEWIHKPPRVMFMACLLIVVFIRSMMLFINSFLGMCFVAVALGITKGIRIVYISVIIPNYVPIERLAYASGFQQLCNGINVVVIGTILGLLRESSGSYKLPIIVLNLITLIPLIIWSVEFLYFKVKNRRNPEQNENA